MAASCRLSFEELISDVGRFPRLKRACPQTRGSGWVNDDRNEGSWGRKLQVESLLLPCLQWRDNRECGGGFDVVRASDGADVDA